MRRAILSDADPARPHRRNVASADDVAEKQVVELAEKRRNLLSESQPKKVDEMMPGMLNLLQFSSILPTMRFKAYRVMSSVEVLIDKCATS